MIGNILKTVGLCLTSLNAFNIQEQRNANNDSITTVTTINTATGSQDQMITHTWSEGDEYTQYYRNKNTYLKQNVTITVVRKRQFTYLDYDDSTDTRIQNRGLYGPQQSTVCYTIIEYTNQANIPAYVSTDEIQAELEIEASLNMGHLTIEYTTGVYMSNDTRIRNLMAENQLTTDEEYNRAMYSIDLNHMLALTTTQEIKKTTNTEVDEDSGTQYIDILPQVNTEQSYQKATNTPLYVIIVYYGVANYELDNYYFELNEFNTTVTTINAVITQEIVDIPGLCFDILTMPFTFISSAFNLTLFPGTPYQVNISNLFLSILGILIFVFIMRKLLSR